MELPIYELMISEDMNDDAEVNFVALVDRPAVQRNWNAFKDKVNFQIISEDKKIISGLLMLADTPIFRSDAANGDYYVTFSKETIAKMVEKFNKYGSNRKINIDHSNMMVDAFIIEDWLTEDLIYDKSRKYGIEVPVGTYMIMVKIEDKEFWKNEVKGNGKFGFSIEGMLGQQLVSLSKEFTIDDLTEEDLLQIFSAIFIADSSNVDRIKYFEEDKRLVVKFNDGSYYTYFDLDEDVFNSIIEGDATCKTSGQNEFGEWEVGKTPSVGAAIWKYLIDKNVRYEQGGSLR